jgi:hypothetical protein
MRATAVMSIVASAAVAFATTASAQSLDGTYNGTITCESIAGTTQRPLRGQLKLVVSGGSATYERMIQTPTGQPSGNYERGNGTVTPAGAISLDGGGQNGGSSMTGTYNGTIGSGVARLTGRQRWNMARGGPDAAGARKCSIEARVAR